MNITYSSPEFEARFHYAGTDLGAVWSPEKTQFRLWAPTAKAVTVNLYASGTAESHDLPEQLPMKADVCGTWIAEKAGDLNGTYYTYLVELEGKTEEACDPYARSTGVNGQRAMILDLSRTDPAGWESDRDPHAGRNVTDAVIYELHIRDLSMDAGSGITHRGKFLGLAETGTATSQGIPTGLDHIRNLGVTHVHLLPSYDFGFTEEDRADPQYNWGYDPVNFNVPEGSYATDPDHGEVRVAEMKQMVKALHDAKLSVILDVVYNHVYDGEDFCFNRIVPGYFSRIDRDGIWSNGSICGNDTASERSMVRKYIVDSVNYWADEYHIDGFRFDLVGLLDVQTMNEIVSTVHEKHPNVIFYGEGWDMPTALTKPGTQLAIQSSSPDMPGFAFFSDTMRDLMRGDIRSNTAPGFAAGAETARQALDASFMGMPEWAAQPCQCVNYVSCHDNHTLFDRIALTAPDASRELRIRMNNLAAAFSILSQGIPFFQAGEEMLRTKPDGKGGFDDNSYRSGDAVNALKWEDLSKEEYRQTADYYRGLLAFRAAHPSLRLQYRDQVLAAVSPIAQEHPLSAAYHIRSGNEELFVIFNASQTAFTAALPEGCWEVSITRNLSGTAPLALAEGTVQAPPVCATVLVRIR
ncbi:MAG: type I pullulanase [Oscillospiraceae bacterium]|nr:type I pullulanase [Oscillospiraceae bacterium]